MKKLLFIICIIGSFIACSDDDDNSTQNPIRNLELPSQETPFLTGQSVTIQGQGFTSESQIWLRATATKATEDIQAKVTEVTDNSITFEVPENVEGEQNILLKQNGTEYELGKLTFKRGSEELYAFMSIPTLGLYHLNLTEKTSEMIYPLEEFINGLTPSSDGKIYFITDYKVEDVSAIECIDLKTKTLKTILKNWYKSEKGRGISIGFIKNQLHGIRYNDNKGFYLVSIDNSGNETEVMDFGKIADINPEDFSSGYDKFEYNSKDNIILMTTDNKEDNLCIGFNLTTKKIIAKKLVNIYNLQCLYINDKCYLFRKSENLKTVITQINPQTLENITSPQTLSEYIGDLYYWKNRNLILGLSSDKGEGEADLERLDLSTGEITSIWKNTDILHFVTIIL